jgi:hypothetical protein
MDLWQKSICLTIAGVCMFFAAIASSICPPVLHMPIVIASASLLIIGLGLVWNLRASAMGSLRMVLLGMIQIAILCIGIWAVAITKN